jgi:hypothetical protein
VSGHTPWSQIRHKRDQRREFTFSVETPEGTTTDEEAFLRVDEAMRAAPGILEAATLLDHRQETISSRFQVESTTLEEAQAIARGTFARALADAGLPAVSRIVDSEG